MTNQETFMRNKILATIAIACAIVIPGGTLAWAQAGQTLPPGYHMRIVRYQVDDCGPRNKGKVKVIFWKGNGDRQSVISCPNETWQSS